jgi:hypothetical protein
MTDQTRTAFNNSILVYYAQCITINLKAPQQTKCYKEVRNVLEANIKDLCFSIQNETWIEVGREINIEKNGIPFTAFLTTILI